MTARPSRLARPEKSRSTAHPPVLVMGLSVGLVAVGGLFFVAIAQGRRSSSHVDGAASSCVDRAAPELEALRLRVAVLSARLANAERCDPPAPTTTALNDRPPPFDAKEQEKGQEEEQAAPVAGSDASVAEAASEHAASDAEALPPLPTAWATETFLRTLAHSAAPNLAVSEVVCSDELCRLSISGSGTAENDAIALQSFVGRTVERLPKTLIQPGVNGAASVVLVARPGHELPDSPKLN